MRRRVALLLGAAWLALGSGACLHRPDQRMEVRREAIDLYADALALEAQAQWREAATLHQRSIALAPTPAAHAHLGRCLMELGDQSAAQSNLRRALELSPSYSLAETYLLESEARQNTEAEPAPAPPEVEEEIIEVAAVVNPLADEESVETDVPTSTEPVTAEASQAAPRSPSLPQPTLTSLLNRPSDGLPPVEEVRALLFPGLQGQATQGTTAPSDLAASHLGQPEFHMAQARGHEERGDLLNALSEYRIAHEMAPDQVEPLLGAAILHERLNQPGESAALFSEAAEIDPMNSEVQLRWGNHLFRQGDPEGAVSHYERALALDPRNVRTLNNQGAALRELGRLDEAMVVLTRAVEINPEYAPPHRNIGNVLAEEGDRRGALEAYQEYVRLGGSESGEVRRWIRELQVELD